MTYIKINKSTLDYNQFADFHVFTMNNLVRNVMQKGKYKKALKIVRLGLLRGLRELHMQLKSPNLKVIRCLKYHNRVNYTKKTRKLIETTTNIRNVKYEIEASRLPTPQSVYSSLNKAGDERTLFYTYLTNKIKSNLKKKFKIPAPSFSFNKLFDEIDSDPENYIRFLSIIANDFEDKYLPKEKITPPTCPPPDRISDHLIMMEKLDFKKIYSKRPTILFSGMRKYTVFDMILQVYQILTGVWYMRKSKVSGRTILIPSPLRPYRRITTVTKMLLKGIRRRRQEERYMRKAMISAIGTEFYWLLLYNGVYYTRYTTMIDNSFVWRAKTESHKELVANLRNIKHLKYF